MGFGDIYRHGQRLQQPPRSRFPHSLSAGDEAWIQKTQRPERAEELLVRIRR